MVIVNPISVKNSKERIQLVMRIVASQENQDDMASNLLIQAADYIDSLENIRLALSDVIKNLQPLVPRMELKDGKILSQSIEELKVFAASFYLLGKAEVKEDERIKVGLKDFGNAVDRFNTIDGSGNLG
jgi:hypothetical protein